MIEVFLFEPQQRPLWRDFLNTSNNGTLFHDLDFLAYHPADKFETHHLIFRENGETVALLPAASLEEANGKRVLKSPYGASVGGFVVPRGQAATVARGLVQRLQEYTIQAGFQGLEMRLGPSFYLCEPDEHLGFGLMAAGFRLTRRWLTHAIALPPHSDDISRLYKHDKARNTRVGLRRGAIAAEATPERLPEFYQLLLTNWARHEAKPTHREEELRDLFLRVPGRIRLFLCHDPGGNAMAGILVFLLNPRAAYTFYICQDNRFKAFHPAHVLLTHVAQTMAAEKFSFLDLGPSTFDDLRFNTGLAEFKEGFGARGFCRDTWRWDRE